MCAPGMFYALPQEMWRAALCVGIRSGWAYADTLARTAARCGRLLSPRHSQPFSQVRDPQRHLAHCLHSHMPLFKPALSCAVGWWSGGTTLGGEAAHGHGGLRDPSALTTTASGSRQLPPRTTAVTGDGNDGLAELQRAVHGARERHEHLRDNVRVTATLKQQHRRLTAAAVRPSGDGRSEEERSVDVPFRARPLRHAGITLQPTHSATPSRVFAHTSLHTVVRCAPHYWRPRYYQWAAGTW